MDVQEDNRSIKELCAPLSAKVQPRSARVTMNGSVMDETKARGLQIRERSLAKTSKRKPQKGKK